jgi:hypothetical protein
MVQECRLSYPCDKQTRCLSAMSLMCIGWHAVLRALFEVRTRMVASPNLSGGSYPPAGVPRPSRT